MATLTPIEPDADGTVNGITTQDGSTTDLYVVVTDNLDSTYLHPGVDLGGNVLLRLSDVDADLDTMDTLSGNFRVRMNGTVADDLTTLTAQIFDGNSTTTALTDAVAVADQTSGGTFTNYVPTFTIQGTPTKAQWNNAYLRLVWTYTKNKSSDGIELQVSELEITGTYTAAAGVIQDASGTVAGTSAATSNATRLVSISATVAGTSSTTGDAVIIRDASATIQGSGTASATPSQLYDVSGAGLATATALADATALVSVDGLLQGSGVTSGSVSVLRDASGILAGAATATGNADLVTSGVVHEASATIQGTSSVSAVASPPRPTGITVTVDGTTLIFDNYEVGAAADNAFTSKVKTLPGFVAAWTQSQTADTWHDEGTYGLDLTVVGATWGASDGPGVALPGRWMMDGVDDHARRMVHDAQLNLGSAGNGSHWIAYWAARTLNNQTDFAGHVTKGDSTYQLRAGTITRDIRYEARGGTGGNVTADNAEGFPTLFEWVFIIAQYDGTTMRIYRATTATGPALLASAARSGTLGIDTASTFVVGAQDNAGTMRRWWAAHFAAVAVGDGEILTETQRTELWESTFL